MKIFESVKKLAAYTVKLQAELVQAKTDLAIALQMPVAGAEAIKAAQDAVMVANEKNATLQALVDADAIEDKEVLAILGELIPPEAVEPPVTDPVLPTVEQIAE